MECMGCGADPKGPMRVWPFGGCITESVEEELDGELTCTCLDESIVDAPGAVPRRRRPTGYTGNNGNAPQAATTPAPTPIQTAQVQPGNDGNPPHATATLAPNPMQTAPTQPGHTDNPNMGYQTEDDD